VAAPAARYLTPAVVQHLRAAVAEAGGNEVFFLGQPGPDGRVEAVRVLARGDRHAVLAQASQARYGDVVLHNHPSGVLLPSAADTAIAASLADEGVGFFITDNEAAEVYAVVEPFPLEQQEQPLDPAAVSHLFAADGPLAAVLPGYEPRPEQGRLAAAVAEAFNGRRVALLEAGTGTGKSLAYLLPAALWARQNQARVLIATGTINLQEQLLGKDIPTLLELLAALRLEPPLRVALIKGRNNYLCRRRLELALREGASLFPAEGREHLATLAAWAETSEAGSRQDLPFLLADDVWDEVAAEADSCGGLACPHHGSCFLMAARRQAARASLLVANHHLFFADMGLRASRNDPRGYAVLPEYRQVILDEAHRLEEAASGFFGAQVSRSGLKVTLGRLYRRRGEAATGFGLLLSARTELARLFPERSRAAGAGLLEQVVRTSRLVEEAFDFVLEWARHVSGPGEGRSEGDEAGSLRVRLTSGTRQGLGWEELVFQGGELAGQLRLLAAGVGDLVAHLQAATQEREAPTLDGLRLELKALGRRRGGAATELERFLAAEADPTTGDGLVRWVEARARRFPVVQLRVAPLQIDEVLHRAVFSPLRTVVLTSATLSTREGEGGFDYLVARLGLGQLPPGRLRTELFRAPFQYAQQALVGVVTDLPEPGGAGFAASCAVAVLQAATLSQGRCFVLFTSFSLLRQVHGQLEPELRRRGLTPLRQGEMGRTQLLEEFRRDGAAVLFGTDSFWEGVDVRGEALQNVVIVRLPFRVPSEPLLEARVEAIAARRGDPFRELTLPQAVIRFRQGFGRLIRSQTDSGVVLILDRRVDTKSYGRRFLDALPAGTPRLVGPLAEVLQGAADFFAGRRG